MGTSISNVTSCSEYPCLAGPHDHAKLDRGGQQHRGWGSRRTVDGVLHLGLGEGVGVGDAVLAAGAAELRAAGRGVRRHRLVDYLQENGHSHHRMLMKDGHNMPPAAVTAGYSHTMCAPTAYWMVWPK